MKIENDFAEALAQGKLTHFLPRSGLNLFFWQQQRYWDATPQDLTALAQRYLQLKEVVEDFRGLPCIVRAIVPAIRRLEQRFREHEAWIEDFRNKVWRFETMSLIFMPEILSMTRSEIEHRILDRAVKLAGQVLSAEELTQRSGNNLAERHERDNLSCFLGIMSDFQLRPKEDKSQIFRLARAKCKAEAAA